MDRRLITDLKKTLEAKHRELHVGLGKTQREALARLQDYGKDEGDRAVASMNREIDASV